MDEKMKRLKSSSNAIKACINSASRSFVGIGFYLKQVRDEALYTELGYTDVWEYAAGEFGISKSNACRFMKINDRFSIGGNSVNLTSQYSNFSYSKLQEMLNMSQEQLNEITEDMTVKQIREIKNSTMHTVPAAVEEMETDDVEFNVCLEENEISENSNVITSFPISDFTEDDQQVEDDADKMSIMINSSTGAEQVIDEEHEFEYYPDSEVIVPDDTTDSKDNKLPELEAEEFDKENIIPAIDKLDEFIDGYEEWPVWIDNFEKTGEVFYRYELQNGVGIVVKTGPRHSLINRTEYKGKDFYIDRVKVKSQVIDNECKFLFDDTFDWTFNDCYCSKTDLIEYLKAYFEKSEIVQQEEVK